MKFPPWEFVSRAPHPQLRGLLSDYQGYRELIPSRVKRREAATSEIPVIFNFGPAFRIGGGYNRGGAAEYSSFLAGLGDTYALVESEGAACCL